jgi:hypothetical protein
MTRFSVPISKVTEMPMETWNSDSRSSRDSGNSADVTSAKGRKAAPTDAHVREIFMPAPIPAPGIDRKSC